MAIKRERSPSSSDESDGNYHSALATDSSPTKQIADSPQKRHSKIRTTVKSEEPSPSAIDGDDDEHPKPPKKTKVSAPKGRPGAKARIGPDAKKIIWDAIVDKGCSHLDVEAIAQLTGLAVQQIKSQIADNRQNIRKQMKASFSDGQSQSGQ